MATGQRCAGARAIVKKPQEDPGTRSTATISPTRHPTKRQLRRKFRNCCALCQDRVVDVQQRPGGETGRRTGLKIPGLERDVPVRFRSRAPSNSSHCCHFSRAGADEFDRRARQWRTNRPSLGSSRSNRMIALRLLRLGAGAMVSL